MTVTRMLDEMTEDELCYWLARLKNKPMKEEKFSEQMFLLRRLLFDGKSFKKGQRDKAIKYHFPDLE